MADPILIVIDVDDKGSGQLRQFAQNATQSFQQVQNAANASVSAATKHVDALSESFLRAARVSVTFRVVNEAFTAVANAFKAGIADVLDFDAALREVASISPEVRNNFEKFRQAIIDTNPALGTTTELAKGLYETFSSGIATNQSASAALAFTAQAAELAKAGLTKTETAVKILSTSLNAYALDLSHATEFSDILFKSVELGQFRFEELAHSIGPVLPIAKTLGVTFGDVNAALATLSQAGFTAANGATALRGAFIDLIQNAQKFKSVGIDVEQVISQKGLLGLFDALTKATGNDIGKVKELIPETRALSAILSLLGQDINKVRQNFSDVNNASGATRVAFNEIKKSGREALADLNSEFDRFVQSLTGPSLKSGITGVRSLTDSFTSLRENIEPVQFLFKTLITDPVLLTLAILEGLFGLVSAAVGGLTASVGALLFLTPGLEEFGLRVFNLGEKAVTLGFDFAAAGNKSLDALTKIDFGLKDTDEQTTKFANSQTAAKESTYAFATAFEQQRRALALGGNTLALVDEGLGNVAKSSGSAAQASSGHNLVLTALSKTAISAGGSFSDITSRFFILAQESTSLSGKLSSLAQGITKSGTNANVSKEYFGQLVDAFIRVEAESLGTRIKLDSLGVTTDDLSGPLVNLSRELVANAAKMGVTEQALVNLVNQYNKSLPLIQQTEVELTGYGVRVDDLRKKIATLVIAQKDSSVATTQLNNDFKVLTGSTFSDFLEKTKGTIDSLTRLKGVSDDFRLESLNKLQEQFDKFGITAPESLVKLRTALEETVPKVSSLQEAAKLLGVSLDVDVNRNLDKLAIAFRLLTSSGNTNAEELEKAAQKIAKAYRDTGIELPTDILNSLDKIQNKAEETSNKLRDTFNDAVKELGQKTFSQVTAAAEKTFERIATATAGGQKNFGELAQVAAKAIQDIINSGQKVPPEYQRVYDELVRSARAAGQDIGSGIAAGFKSAGTELDKLNEQLKGFSKTEKFGSDLRTLQEQLNQRFSELHNLQGDAFADPAYVRYASGILLKEISIITEKIAALEKQSASTAETPTSGTTAPTNSNTTAPTNSNTSGSTATGKPAGGTVPSSGILPSTKLPNLTGTLRSQSETATIRTNPVTGSVDITGGPSGSLVVGQGNVSEGLLTPQAITAYAAAHFRPLDQVVADGPTVLADSIQELKAVITQSIGNPLRIAAAQKLLNEERMYTGPFPETNSVPISSGGTGSSVVSLNPKLLQSLRGLPKFANGTIYANTGQNVSLEAGEAVLTRRQAESYRQETPKNIRYSSGVSWDTDTMSALGRSGFTFTPGHGYVPNFKMAAATGRLNTLFGENAQRELQRVLTPILTKSLDRKDLTRPISKNTALSRKGKPALGGS